MNPIATIIIPCLEESQFIIKCLENVIAFDKTEGDFEILVVDGMSKDGTREIIKKFINKDRRIKLVDNPNKTASFALNTGIRMARGEYIIRIDVHSEYASDYLTQCLRIAKMTGADNVGGPALTKSHKWIQNAIAVAYHSKFAVCNARFHNSKFEGIVDTVPYGCYKTTTLLQIGMFDEDLARNQDDELNLRLTRRGGIIWQSPCIKSWYYPRERLYQLFKQYMQYGYWKVRVIQKHRIPASWRHLIPGFFVFFVFWGGLMAIFFSFIFYLWISIFTFYIFCVLIASMNIAIKNNWRILPILPIVFLTYHFSYGIGFLMGMIDFILLRNRKLQRFNSLSR